MIKNFDCVEMKHKGAERIYKKIEKLSIDEEVKFWQTKTDNLKIRKRKIAKKDKITAEQTNEEMP